MTIISDAELANSQINPNVKCSAVLSSDKTQQQEELIRNLYRTGKFSLEECAEKTYRGTLPSEIDDLGTANDPNYFAPSTASRLHARYEAYKKRVAEIVQGLANA